MAQPRIIANPARTAIQAVPAFAVTEFWDAFVSNLSDKQYAALAGLLLIVFSVVQNGIEQYKGKILFKPKA